MQIALEQFTEVREQRSAYRDRGISMEQQGFLMLLGLLSQDLVDSQTDSR